MFSIRANCASSVPILRNVLAQRPTVSMLQPPIFWTHWTQPCWAAFLASWTYFLKHVSLLLLVLWFLLNFYAALIFSGYAVVCLAGYINFRECICHGIVGHFASLLLFLHMKVRNKMSKPIIWWTKKKDVLKVCSKKNQ